MDNSKFKRGDLVYYLNDGRPRWAIVSRIENDNGLYKVWGAWRDTADAARESIGGHALYINMSNARKATAATHIILKLKSKLRNVQ